MPLPGSLVKVVRHHAGSFKPAQTPTQNLDVMGVPAPLYFRKVITPMFRAFARRYGTSEIHNGSRVLVDPCNAQEFRLSPFP